MGHHCASRGLFRGADLLELFVECGIVVEQDGKHSLVSIDPSDRPYTSSGELEEGNTE